MQEGLNKRIMSIISNSDQMTKTELQKAIILLAEQIERSAAKIFAHDYISSYMLGIAERLADELDNLTDQELQESIYNDLHDSLLNSDLAEAVLEALDYDEVLETFKKQATKPEKLTTNDIKEMSIKFTDDKDFPYSVYVNGLLVDHYPKVPHTQQVLDTINSFDWPQEFKKDQ